MFQTNWAANIQSFSSFSQISCFFNPVLSSGTLKNGIPDSCQNLPDDVNHYKKRKQQRRQNEQNHPTETTRTIFLRQWSPKTVCFRSFKCKFSIVGEKRFLILPMAMRQVGMEKSMARMHPRMCTCTGCATLQRGMAMNLNRRLLKGTWRSFDNHFWFEVQDSNWY